MGDPPRILATWQPGNPARKSRTPATTLISSSVASKSISQSAATTVTTFPPFGSSDPGAPAWAAAGYGPPAWIASAVAQYQESLRLHGQNATVPSNSTQAPLTSSGPVTASTTGTASLATAPANAPASSISPAYKTVVAVLGTSLFTVIVGLIAYWVLRRRRAKQRKDTRSDGDSPGSHSPSTLHHQPTMEQAFEVDSPLANTERTANLTAAQPKAVLRTQCDEAPAS
ncbi:MAG: hypothetical protein LQ350_008340 [Teloschistes chrysophthalmus]|nr:MAG: hypothetical protein LQ350_008340 [Niorma chrysophthalma]